MNATRTNLLGQLQSLIQEMYLNSGAIITVIPYSHEHRDCVCYQRQSRLGRYPFRWKGTLPSAQAMNFIHNNYPSVFSVTE